MKKIIFLLLIAGLYKPCSSQKLSGDTVTAINSIFEKWNSTNTPGVSLAISRHGEIIYSRAWGMADLENKIPNTPSTVFPVASLSKQFTAAAILLLEKEKKLSLDDDVRKYLPELPDFGHTITIRHLLNHTSGLRDWTNLLLFTGVDRFAANTNNQFILQLLAKQNELNNLPGDEFIYSNSNYTLLPIIVERVSGQSFIDFCHKNIFDPLRLDHTEWLSTKNNEPTATSYSSSGNGFIKVLLPQKILGHAGLMTTTEDLLKWNQAYLSGQLAGASFLNKQLKKGRLNNGTTIPYAAGLRIGNYKGNKFISHNGLGNGNVSFLEYFPEYDFSFVLLSNTSEINPVLICRRVEDLFITPKSAGWTSSDLNTSVISMSALKPFEGWYRNTKTGGSIQLLVLPDKSVSINGDTLRGLSQNIFSSRDNQLRLPESSTEKILFITNLNLYADSSWYERVNGPRTAGNSQNIYQGSYYSEELNSTVIIDGSENLSLQLANKKNYQLKASYEDGFAIIPGLTMGPNNLYFVRDKTGNLVGLRISIDRARNVYFEKRK